MALPEPIHHYLGTLPGPHRAPLYFLVDAGGTLLESGGAYEDYGLSPIPNGQRMTEHPVFFFLESLLPLSDAPEWIPYLAWASGRFVDVHLLPAPQGSWVLLLDSTPEALLVQTRQQRHHEQGLKLKSTRG